MGFNPVSAIGKIALWRRLIITYEGAIWRKKSSQLCKFYFIFDEKVSCNLRNAGQN